MTHVLPVLGAVALSTLLAVGVACTSKTVPSDPVLARGQQVYDQSCASCHGEAGLGKTGPSLVGVDRRYPDVKDQIAVITNGRISMPAWEGRLSTEEIAAVAAYSRTFQKK